jgi:predicted mannosyl-3-phosphoglycerate phosphatase (HAD superfamily)
VKRSIAERITIGNGQLNGAGLKRRPRSVLRGQHGACARQDKAVMAILSATVKHGGQTVQLLAGETLADRCSSLSATSHRSSAGQSIRLVNSSHRTTV